MRIDNRRDILLLLLYSPGATDSLNEPISGRTRITKALFLFKMEVLKDFRKGTCITEDNFYEFFPWNFGPFSQQVFDDIGFFQLHGFIDEGPTEEETIPESAAEWEQWLRSPFCDATDQSFSDYEEQSYSLSTKGAEFCLGLYEQLVPNQRALLKAFKARIVRAPLRGLLRYVYQKFPDQIVNSEIRNQVLDSNGMA